MAISAVPILPVGTLSGNQFRASRLIEEASQTFMAGTPICVASGDGGLQAWGGTVGTNGTLAQGAIGGIAYEAASNLGALGVGPAPMAPFGGLGAVAGTFGSVPNESLAKNIAHGAPINDGRCGFYSATPDTIFSAMFGNTGNTATPAATDIGLYYGLTIDSNSKFWYVDKGKATQSTNTCVRIIGIDQRATVGAGSIVFFVFDPRFTYALY